MSPDTGDEADLKQRVVELEKHIAELEQQLGQPRELSQESTDYKKLARPLLYISAVVVFAILPSLMIFRDRWLGYGILETPLSDVWRNIPFFLHSGLPPYFAVIFIGVCLLALLMLYWKEDQFLVCRNNSPVVAASDNVTASPRLLHFSNAAFLAAGIIFLGAFGTSLLTKSPFGWGYLIALLLYGIGWLLREVDWSKTRVGWSRNWELILAFLLAHIGLILFLDGLASGSSFNWILAILFVLALANLIRYYRRIPTILWIVNLAIFFYLLNINRWMFSVVGDAFGFFMKASEILTGQSFQQVVSNLFLADGVYGTHPYFSSIVQVFFMRLLGADSFGWRFSSLYLSAIAIYFFYVFYKYFFPESTALLASLLLAASSYLMTFGKIGYNNLQSLFTMSLMMASLAWALDSKRRLAYVALGLSMGLCLYVYPAAMLVLPIPILGLAFYDLPNSRQAIYRWLIMLLSFFVLLAPLLIQPAFWAGKAPGLFFNNPELTKDFGSLVSHFATNLMVALMSFLYIPHESHFVVSSYVDPLSGAFVLIGLIYATKWCNKDRGLAFLLVSFVVTLLLVGVSHDRRYPPNTRMFLLLPWFVLFAAMGLQWLVERIKAMQLTRSSKTSLITLFIVLIIGLNLIQTYSLSPIRSAGEQTMEVMFVRLMEHIRRYDPEVIVPKTILFITTAHWDIDGFYWLQIVYDYPASKIRLMRVPIGEPKLPLLAEELIKDRSTMVVIQPDMNEAWKKDIGQALQDKGKLSCEIKEFTKRNTRFVLWMSPEDYPLCGSIP